MTAPSLVVVLVFIVFFVVFDEQAVRLRERQHVAGVGADRVLRDAFEQGVPHLFGCRHRGPPRRSCRR
jgi:hypothetical protein